MNHITAFLTRAFLKVYETRHAKLVDSAPHEFQAAWRSFVGISETEGLVFKFLGGTYVAYVLMLDNSSHNHSILN